MIFLLLLVLVATVGGSNGSSQVQNPPGGYIDTMPPVLIRDSDSCGTRTVEATELRNIPNPVRRVPLKSDQVETGIAAIEIVEGSASYNYALTLHTHSSFPSKPAYTTFRYTWKVIDSLRDARVEYVVRDFYDNVAFDTSEYKAPSFIDTVPPVTVQVLHDGQQWVFEATEVRNATIPNMWCPVSGLQRESGLVPMRFVTPALNMRLTVAATTNFLPDSTTKSAMFTAWVVDPRRRASGIVQTSDRSGNVTYDTLRYEVPTSIDEMDPNTPSISIIPNPAADQCRVVWSSTMHVTTLEIVDLRGRVVLLHTVQSGETEALVNMSPLPKGVYAVLLKGASTYTEIFTTRY